MRAKESGYFQKGSGMRRHKASASKSSLAQYCYRLLILLGDASSAATREIPKTLGLIAESVRTHADSHSKKIGHDTQKTKSRAFVRSTGYSHPALGS
jgi:hypothetical protein